MTTTTVATFRCLKNLRPVWSCPPFQVLTPHPKRGVPAATLPRPSSRPRSASSACSWWSWPSSSSAGCPCTPPTPGKLSTWSRPPEPSRERPSPSSTCCLTHQPASTPSFTALWTPASGRPFCPPSPAAAVTSSAACAARAGGERREKTVSQLPPWPPPWRPPCPSSATQPLAPPALAKRNNWLHTWQSGPATLKFFFLNRYYNTLCAIHSVIILPSLMGPSSQRSPSNSVAECELGLNTVLDFLVLLISCFVAFWREHQVPVCCLVCTWAPTWWRHCCVLLCICLLCSFPYFTKGSLISNLWVCECLGISCCLFVTDLFH